MKQERIRIINSPEYREAECFLFPLMLKWAEAKTVGDNVDLTIECMNMLRHIRDKPELERLQRENERLKIENTWQRGSDCRQCEQHRNVIAVLEKELEDIARGAKYGGHGLKTDAQSGGCS